MLACIASLGIVALRLAGLGRASDVLVLWRMLIVIGTFCCFREDCVCFYGIEKWAASSYNIIQERREYLQEKHAAWVFFSSPERNGPISLYPSLLLYLIKLINYGYQ